MRCAGGSRRSARTRGGSRRVRRRAGRLGRRRARRLGRARGGGCEPFAPRSRRSPRPRRASARWPARIDEIRTASRSAGRGRAAVAGGARSARRRPEASGEPGARAGRGGARRGERWGGERRTRRCGWPSAPISRRGDASSPPAASRAPGRRQGLDLAGLEQRMARPGGGRRRPRPRRRRCASGRARRTQSRAEGRGGAARSGGRGRAPARRGRCARRPGRAEGAAPA